MTGPSLRYGSAATGARSGGPPARPGDVEMKEVTEKAWLAATRDKVQRN